MKPAQRTFLSAIDTKILWLAAALTALLVTGGYFYYSNSVLATRTLSTSEASTAVAYRRDLVGALFEFLQDKTDS